MKAPRRGKEKKSQASATGSASGSGAWMLAKDDEVETFNKERRPNMGASERKKRKGWGVDGDRTINFDRYSQAVQGSCVNCWGAGTVDPWSMTRLRNASQYLSDIETT